MKGTPIRNLMVSFQVDGLCYPAVVLRFLI